jgi:restriction endonuclease S subunit
MIVRLRHENYLAGYLSEFLSLGLLRQYFESFSIGSIMDSLSSGTLLAMPMIEPPADEQSTIIAFLDLEIGKLDTLVAEQRRLVELLKEKRQAVISHAVTKGLNPDAPMKDSGIEWLGEVPAHWKVTPILYAAKLESGHTPSRSPRNIGRIALNHGSPWRTCGRLGNLDST